MESPKVYASILKVTQDMAKGIEKTKPDAKSAKPGTPDYPFRGIDQVYNTLNPALVKNNLVILPSYHDRQVSERLSSRGNSLFTVTVRGVFDFVSTEDGSKHTIEIIGEAMDSGDKATNKAMSIAYKYACFQAFCIPTEELDDPDKQVHEVRPETVQKNETQSTSQEPKPTLVKGSKAWDAAAQVARDTGSIERVKAKMIVSSELEQELMSGYNKPF